MIWLKDNYKIILKYIFLFSLFLIWNIFIQQLNADEIWNFGFSYGIYKGEIPYVDFNMVIPLFFPFLFAIPFFIFGPNMLIFHIQNALILTFTCYLLFKMLDKRAWYIILFLFIPLSVIYPSYNILLFVLFILIIYLEENKGNDYLIGLILGFLFLTKHTVGLVMLLPSFYYIKDKNKILKRICSFSIVMMVFFIYLILTNSIAKFLDLCVFGLFDFTSSNLGNHILYYFIFLILIVVDILLIKKDVKDIKNYYVLAFYSIAIPLFDLYHIQLAFLALLFLICYKNKDKKLLFRPVLFTILVIGCVSFIEFCREEIVYPNNIKHFEYRTIGKNVLNFTNNINKFIKDNKNKEIIFLDYNAYYFRICNDMKIGNLDLVNEGNFGYNGSNKLIKIIKNKKNALYLINPENINYVQTDKKVLKYITKYGKKIDKIEYYDVYTLNDI